MSGANTEDAIYVLTPKGKFYNWIREWRDLITDALINLDPDEAAYELWPQIADIFDVNYQGYNEELQFLRDYVYRHGMHFDAAQEWGKLHKE